MLEFVSWRHEPRAFGRIRCTPPEGEELGEIVIDDRIRPLTSLRALVEERSAAGGAIEPATQLATAEGELGVVIDFDVAGMHHTLGVIYGDDFQTIVEGRTTRLDQRERIRRVTRELVLNLPLGLGQNRYRRFWYRPPPGWHGVVRALVTDWYPPDHPPNPASIKVLPARPQDARFLIDTLLRDETFANLGVDDVVRTRLTLNAFIGTLGRASFGQRAFLTAVLEDGHYLYVMRLTTTSARLAVDEPIFHDLLRTCVPLPRPAADRPSPVELAAFAHLTL